MDDKENLRGKDEEGKAELYVEPQEKYEEEGGRDEITGGRSLDPFDHRAPESDHTPNHTAEPKKAKVEYGKFSTGRFGL